MTPRKPIWQLFTERTDALKAFFRRRLHDETAAGDLTQEVYLRLLRSSTETIENPEAYLFAVARNLVTEYSLMKRRQVQREALMDPLDLPDVGDEVALEQDLDHERLVQHYLAVVQTLPPRQQAALKMFYEQELSQIEIGQRLGISRQMVQKILTQALAQCRDRMSNWRRYE